MIKFKEKKKDRISVIENTIVNILDTLKNLTDTQKDIIENYEYLRRKFNTHKHRIHTRYSTGSPMF